MLSCILWNNTSCASNPIAQTIDKHKNESPKNMLNNQCMRGN